jgi:hypothetical protein
MNTSTNGYSYRPGGLSNLPVGTNGFPPWQRNSPPNNYPTNLPVAPATPLGR